MAYYGNTKPAHCSAARASTIPLATRRLPGVKLEFSLFDCSFWKTWLRIQDDIYPGIAKVALAFMLAATLCIVSVFISAQPFVPGIQKNANSVTACVKLIQIRFCPQRVSLRCLKTSMAYYGNTSLHIAVQRALAPSRSARAACQA